MFFELDAFPFRFMLENLYILIFGIKYFLNFSMGPPMIWGIFHFLKNKKK